MAPVLLIVALTPVLAARAGMVRLLVRRREVRSGSYSNLVSPKDAFAGAEAWLWWQSRQRKSAAGQGRGKRAKETTQGPRDPPQSRHDPTNAA